MIIIGSATIYSNNLNLEKEYTSENGISFIEVIKSSIKHINDDPLIEFDIMFVIQMQRDPECKSSEDYTGKVFPFLAELLKTTISSVKIYKIDESEGPLTLKHITEILTKDLS